ncbi:MAG: hypothetical protein ACRD3Q_15365 [Terriglobales bacterium]
MTRSTKSSSRTAEAQGIQAGVYKAFTDWLEWHSATSPEELSSSACKPPSRPL